MRFFISILSLLIFNNLFAQDNSIVLASDVWPPFTDVDGEKSVAIHLVSEALSRIEVKHEIEIVQFKDVISGIHEGNYSGSAALWKNPDREEYLIFSEPYLQNQLVLVGLKGSDPDHTDLSGLEGKRLGLVKDYSYETHLMNDDKVSIVFSKNDQENLEKLFDEQIDFMLVDALLIHYLIEYQTNHVEQFLEIGEKPF